MDSQHINQSSPALIAVIHGKKFDDLFFGRYSFPWGLPADWNNAKTVREMIDLIDSAGRWGK
jgi:hypothetical protein